MSSHRPQPWRASLAAVVPTLALVLAGALASGCGDDDDAATRDAAVDAGPILDPRSFDCTSLGGPDGGLVPARASTVPVACGLDRACRTPQISGHRGAGGELGALAPEDSLAAYRAAIALGIEFVETDPRPTADGVIVNVHDTTVDRTTDGRGSVDAMTFAEVRALHLDTGKLAGDYSCEQVPTLVEILRTCKGRVLVLVDANKTDRVDLLVQAILDADALDWAIFDTSSLDKIDRALAIEPRLQFMIRPDTVADISTQLDHFAPRVPTIVELGPSERAAGAPVVHTRGSRVLSDVFVEDGLAIVQHDLSGYARALDLGVDILQSDRPDLVLELYRQRGLR